MKKTLVIPALLVLATLTCGFALPQARSGKVIRTREGLWLIPSDVKMSQADVLRVAEIARNGSDHAALAYKDGGGLLQIEGAACLSDFRQTASEFNINLEPTKAAAAAGWFWRNKIKTKDHFTETTAGGDARIKSLDERLTPILKKYMR